MITVLLVEDEPEVLELTRLFLETDPELSIDACLSVKEALRKLDHKIYNVIVSDYIMPEITGIQLLKTLKLQGINTPLIIFTGKGGEDVAIEALNSGAVFYLQKSDTPRFQFAKLKKMIYKAALTQRTEEIYRENDIGVVIPVYNEEKRIGPTLNSVPDYIFRVYVVDDASTDRTPEVIREFAAKDSRIIYIRHDKNKGFGASIRSGYREALKDSMDITMVMTGDNQMNPANLPAFLDPIIKRRADYVVGNRLQSPQYIKGITRWRFFNNTVLTLFTKISSGYWQVGDPQNVFTAISGKALERIDPNKIFPRRGYFNDILVRLNTYGFKAVNVNYRPNSDAGAEMPFTRNRTNIFIHSGLLFRDFLWRMKEKYIVLNFHPLVFFYFLGILCVIMSLLWCFYALYVKIFQMGPLFTQGALALILLFIGSIFILFAMLFDMEQERNIGQY